MRGRVEAPVEGVLVVDKPAGMTSHDVVAVARRALGERRIGHTGTLDPFATGVLPLAVGRATRLVRFLSASDKDYDATVRFGTTTDTYDATGTVVETSAARPARDAVEHALGSLRGAYAQTPPPYSAKKVGGQRAYALARKQVPIALAPVPVRVTRAEITGWFPDTVTIALTCSAGFYVRSFAHALGGLVGTGACLEALRRTRSGQFTLAHAIPLPLDAQAVAPIVPFDRLLPELPAVRLSEGGRQHVAHGRRLGPDDYCPETPGQPAVAAGTWLRLLDVTGALVALAQPDEGGRVLHPSIVLI